MSTRPTALTEALHDYLLAHGVRESAVMRRLREETARHEMGLMQISPEQGALMALLVELIGARRALEVGVFTGYSALVVAQAMGAEGRLTALDIDADYTGIAQRYWAEAGLAERIELRLGDARESLAALRADGLDGHYDFAFIDADKSGYDIYYEHCLALVRSGGLILIDNTFHMGQIAEPARWSENTPVVDDLNKKIHGDERVTIAMLPVGDGLTICRKRGEQARKEYPPPHPSPLLHLLISLKRRALAPLAWLPRLAARGGGEGETGGCGAVPSLPLGAERARERWGSRLGPNVPLRQLCLHCAVFYGARQEAQNGRKG